MKSILFKSAWSIKKMQNVSFSEALTLAWSKIKEGTKAVIIRSNKLVKSTGLGYETIYFNELVYQSIKIVSEAVKSNPAIEKYYNVGIFNND